MRLRMIAAAMLFNGDDLLMMKRAPERTLHPGMWAAVGGHLEPQELNDPETACLREIHEETGLLPHEIRNFKMQYILIRLKDNEIRQQFFYIGETVRRNVSETGEGELHWIPRKHVLQEDRHIPFVYRSLLEHYLTFGPAPHLWVATAGWTDVQAPGTPTLHWTPLLDPNVI
ncbi:NUDIX hydrolase [Paenibacillus sp. CC-CFT747]|nr:NUDIX hydrolase [Paenibacillus sp. CC-CFT747]